MLDYNKLEKIIKDMGEGKIKFFVEKGENREEYSIKDFLNWLKKRSETDPNTIYKVIDFLKKILDIYESYGKSNNIEKVCMMLLLERSLFNMIPYNKINAFQGFLNEFDDRSKKLFNEFTRNLIIYNYSEMFEKIVAKVSNDFMKFLIVFYSIREYLLDIIREKEINIDIIEQNIRDFFDKLKIDKSLKKIDNISEILKYIESKIGKRSFFKKKRFLERLKDLYEHMIGYLSVKADEKIKDYKKLLESLDNLSSYLEKIAESIELILNNVGKNIKIFNEEYQDLIRKLDRVLRRTGRSILENDIIKYTERTKELLIKFYHELRYIYGSFKKFKDEFLNRHQTNPNYVLLTINTKIKEIVPAKELYSSVKSWLEKSLEGVIL